MIELVMDFVSVNAYLALQPAKALADELSVELKLTPLRTPSELQSQESPSVNETVGERHRRVRAAYTRMDALRYADVQGLPIAIDGYDVDSTVALHGLLAANEAGVGFEYASKLFRAYWSGEISIDSEHDVASVLDSSGVGDFNSVDWVEQLVTLREDALSRGVFAVPLFIVAGEKYLGRQHLPMIRWQLTDYEGQGPL